MQETQPVGYDTIDETEKNSLQEKIAQLMNEIESLRAPVLKLELEVDDAFADRERDLLQRLSEEENAWLNLEAVQIEAGKLFGFEDLDESETIENIIRHLVFRIEHSQKVSPAEFSEKLEIFLDDSFDKLRQQQQQLLRLKSHVSRQIGLKLTEAAEILKNNLDTQQLLETILSETTTKISISILLVKYFPDLISVIGALSGLEVDTRENNEQLYQRIFNPLGLFERFKEVNTIFSTFLTTKNTELTDKEINSEEFYSQIQTVKTALSIAEEFFVIFEKDSKEVRQAKFITDQFEFIFEDKRIVVFCSKHPEIFQGLDLFLKKKIQEWKGQGFLSKTGENGDEGDGEYFMKMEFELRLPKPDSDQRLILNQNMLTNFMTNSVIPNIFFKDIGLVQFVERDSPKRDSFPEVVDEYDKLSARLIEANNREYVYKRLFHEVFEHTRNILDIDDMKEWDEVLNNESENRPHISWYSRYSEHNPDLKSWKKEDFCDSGSLYVVSPRELVQLSPERYLYFVRLFTKYLSEDIREKYVEIKMKQFADIQSTSQPITKTNYEKQESEEFVEAPGEKPKARTIASHIHRSYVKRPEKSKIKGERIVVTGPMFTPNL